MSDDCSCLLSCGTYCEHGFPTLAEAERLRTLWFRENSAAQAALGRARELADALLAGGCHYGHQQGETSECNACTAFLFLSAIDGKES